MRKTFAPDAKDQPAGFAERLALFLKVCDRGSFSAAARELGLAPSSVARQVDALERQVGSVLLTRSTRHLGLTEAGELLRERGGSALAELDDARGAVANLDQAPRGRLRLGASLAFGHVHVQPALAGFLRRYPEVQVELLLDNAFVDLVEQRIDLAVRIGALADSSLVAWPVAPQLRVVCAAPAYLKRRGIPRRPEDLLQHDCLTVPGAPLRDMWVFGEGAKQRRIAVRGRLLCRSTEALVRAGIDGLGVVHLPTWLVGDAVRAGRLVRLFPDLPMAQGETGIHLVRPAGPVSVKVRALIDHLKQYFGSPPYWDRDLQKRSP